MEVWSCCLTGSKRILNNEDALVPGTAGMGVGRAPSLGLRGRATGGFNGVWPTLLSPAQQLLV